jgi:hypothetical protein
MQVVLQELNEDQMEENNNNNVDRLWGCEMVQYMLNPLVLCLQINSWSGSVEIGVTACDPDCLEFPSSATDLRGGSWVRLSLFIVI